MTHHIQHRQECVQAMYIMHTQIVKELDSIVGPV